MSESTAGAKSPQSGLVDMGDIDFYNDPSDPTPTFTICDLNGYAGSFSEIVLNVTWAQLQPTEDGTLDLSAIKQAITQVGTYNTANHTDVGIKLRVWGGYTAPSWVQALDGPPVTVSGVGTIDPNKNQAQTIGRFWTADYNNAWTNFQSQLAAIYDGNAIIRGISETQGAAATDEPFVPLHPDQVSQLESAGYTDAAEEQTLRGAIADYNSWSTTPLDYTMNLFHQEDSGHVVGDANFTLAVLQLANNSGRIVQAGNHALNNPWPGADSFVYAQMQADAALNPNTAPGSYQTASPVNLKNFTNWGSAVFQGAVADAGDIELWDGPGTTGFVGQPSSFVAGLATTLDAGVPPATGAPDNGAALGFIAPGSAIGVNGTATFSGVDAVLLATAAIEPSYTVTVASLGGHTLSAAIPGSSIATGSTLTFSGSLDQVNTDLARLTEALPAGTDVLQFTATDSIGDTASRTVGVVASGARETAPIVQEDVTSADSAAPVTYVWSGLAQNALFSDADNWQPTSGPPGTADIAIFPGTVGIVTVAGNGTAGTLIVDTVVVPGGGSTLTIGQSGTGDLDIGDALGSSGELILGGVNTTVTVAGNLAIGGSATNAGGNGVLLAALAPGDASTASLTVGGTVQVWGQGTARLTGLLSANAIEVDTGGLIAGDGTVSAGTSGTIANNWVIEAVADETVGLQTLTLIGTVAGTGRLLVDPAATLILDGAVVASQTIDFLPNSIAQFANDPASPSSLVLDDPLAMQGTIVGFTFADELTLIGVDGTTANYVGNMLTIVEAGGGTLTLPVYGDLTRTTPVISETGTGAAAITTVNFVASGLGQPPSVSAPTSLRSVVGVPVLVPDIVLQTPLPASPSNNDTILVTLVAATGTLTAGNDNGNTTIQQLTPQTLILSGTLGAVERSLQTLLYQGATMQTADTIEVTVSDYDSSSATVPIAVSIGTVGAQFNWATPGGGSFGDPKNWTGVASGTPPGGADTAAFDPGLYTVSGDGAVGQITDSGSVTFTGQISAQGVTVDAGGALTLAGGAMVTASTVAIIGNTGDGMLTLMGGALALTGTTDPDALIIGASAASSGTVLDLEQITAQGSVVVGQGGSGALRLLGAGSTLNDGGGDIGQLGTGHGIAVVDGGFWVNSGQLTVGDAGYGSLLIGGASDGITGQVTAFDATIGAQSGATGIVTLTGGDLLVGNATAPTSTLAVGAAGAGALVIDGGGNANVGVAEAQITNTTTAYDTGMLTVGGTMGGSGLVTIGDGSLLVDGSASVGGTIGGGTIEVGTVAADTALLAMTGTLTIGSTGTVVLGGPGAILRAGAVTLASGGLLSGAGVVSGDGGGNNTVQLSSIANDGMIAANGGDLLVYGGISGVGTLAIGTNAAITLQAAVGPGQMLEFGSGAQAVLDDVLAFVGTIVGFATHDVLDLASTDVTGATWNSGTLTLAAGTPITLNVAGSYAANDFLLQSDGLGGTRVELACFAAGTRILTAHGMVAVEALVVGDQVMTFAGEWQPISWLGCRRVDCLRHPRPEAVWPVRIAAGAFGAQCPGRDVYLSPDHAVYAEGVLIPLRYLINGTTLRQTPVPTIVYYHLELASHDVVLAEGLATETYLDTGTRGAFANATGAVQLHPSFGRAEASLLWDAQGYAPLRVTGPEVQRVRALLAARTERRLDRLHLSGRVT